MFKNTVLTLILVACSLVATLPIVDHPAATSELARRDALPTAIVEPIPDSMEKRGAWTWFNRGGSKLKTRDV